MGQAIHCGTRLAIGEDSVRETERYTLGEVIAERFHADLVLGAKFPQTIRPERISRIGSNANVHESIECFFHVLNLYDNQPATTGHRKTGVK